MWERIVKFVAPLEKAVQMLLGLIDSILSNATRILFTWLIGLLFMLGAAAYLVAFFAKADMSLSQVQLYAAVAVAVAALAQAVVLWLFEVSMGSWLGDPDEELVEKSADKIGDRLAEWVGLTEKPQDAAD